MQQVAAAISIVDVLDVGKAIIRDEALALSAVTGPFDQNFVRAIRILEACRDRVMKFGIEMLGLNTKKISAMLFSTSTPNFFIHPNEITQGDLDRKMVFLFHPGDSLDRKLLSRIKDFKLDRDFPLLHLDENLEDVIFQMNCSKIAIDIIYDKFKPLGVIADYDLRRVFQRKVIENHKVKAYEIMAKTPNFIQEYLI